MRVSGFDPIPMEIFHRRLKVITLLVGILFFTLVFRLWYLQIVHGPGYRIKSENNRIHLNDIPPFRGRIFDRDGALLVDNRPSYDLYIIPEESRNRAELLQSLNALIGLSQEVVGSKLTGVSLRHSFRPVLIKKDMSREELAIIESNLYNLPGVMVQVNPQRHYIHGTLASHLIGYLGEINEKELNNGQFPNHRQGDMIGKYGVEGRWQKYLSGLRGGEQVEVDATGRTLQMISRRPPVSGANVTLTIDKNLQMVAEKALRDKKGAIVAMDPRSGEILALASSPVFDPNEFVGGIERGTWRRLMTNKDSPLQNRAISGQYPPGSLFKIVVSLAGLEEGIINPEEGVLCTGSYPLGNHIFRCWKKHGHGSVTFQRALVESCDVFFYKTGKQLGVDRIAKYAQMVGLGSKTGFNLDFEKEGLIPTSAWKLKRWGVPWQAGETLSTSIGQSYVLVTPLQMAGVISSVFNGGYLYQPTIIRQLGENDHGAHLFKPTVMGKLKVKEENLNRIKRALEGVVNESRGTGGKARMKEIIVAGKTGTAQVIGLEAEKGLDRAGDVPDEYKDHAWFVAIAPTDNPRLSLSILVENGGHGGSEAAPIAKEMIKAYLGGG